MVSIRNCMAIGIMRTTPQKKLTMEAAWVKPIFQTFVKYVIIIHIANAARISAHMRTAKIVKDNKKFRKKVN